VPGFWLGPKATARGYRLHGFDAVGSTSSEAAEAARAGDVGDVWFAALQQTAGRGRRGRPWETPHGNLAASLLSCPLPIPAVIATLGFVAGVALHDALSGP
jgi:BirA family transcriptional regulator, biotin operon repressor / biotin---[acetyl-CoA-carboxylase] ligase